MRDFFRGWKHKAGCLTLMLACVFAAGWVRSRSQYDLVMLPWQDDTYCIESAWGAMDFGRLTVHDNRTRATWKSDPISATTWRWRDQHGNPMLVDHLSEVEEIEWRWDWGGFHFGAGNTGQSRGVDFIFPYWSFAVPLTLVSAILLFSKSRQPQPPTGPSVRHE